MTDREECFVIVFVITTIFNPIYLSLACFPSRDQACGSINGLEAGAIISLRARFDANLTLPHVPKKKTCE